MYGHSGSLVALTSFALLLSSCGLSYTTVYQPYPGSNPSIPLAQATDMCERIGERERNRAKAEYEARKQKNYNVTPNASGGYIVQQQTGGFWSGMAEGGSRALKGSEAYKVAFDGCMAEQGYQKTRIKRSELAEGQKPAQTAEVSVQSRVVVVDDVEAWRTMMRTNLTTMPVSYPHGDYWGDDRPPTPDEGYAALGLLLSPQIWVSSPLIGHPWTSPWSFTPQGPKPGTVGTNLIDDGELAWSRLPKGMASEANTMCTADPRGRVGEEVVFWFSTGMNIGYRMARIDNVFSDAYGRSYVSIDTEKVLESIGSPVFTGDMCIVAFISDSQVQKGLGNTIARNILDILEIVKKAKPES